MSNAVLDRFSNATSGRWGGQQTGYPSAPPQSYPPQSQQWQAPPPPAQQWPQTQQWPPAPAPTRYMTLDDVVQRTGAMLGVLFVAGAVAWMAPRDVSGVLALVGGFGGLGLGLYMAFRMKANAGLCLTYAALEGLLLGAISRVFNDAYQGIVIQAVTGTVCVAGGMLFVYKTGAIRVTPKFTKIVVGATLGVVGLMIVNLIASLFTDGGLGLRDGGPLAIVFSLAVIAIAAFNLVLDFDMVEKGIKNGADERFAWFASFGLVVTLVWLYIEILRLLSYLRDN